MDITFSMSSIVSARNGIVRFMATSRLFNGLFINAIAEL